MNTTTPTTEAPAAEASAAKPLMAIAPVIAFDAAEMATAEGLIVSQERRRNEAIEATKLGREELERNQNKIVRAAEANLQSLRNEAKGSTYYQGALRDVLSKLAVAAIEKEGTVFQKYTSVVREFTGRDTRADLLFTFSGVVLEGQNTATDVAHLSQDSWVELSKKTTVFLGLRTPTLTVIANTEIDQISALRDVRGTRVVEVKDISQEVEMPSELLEHLAAWLAEDTKLAEAVSKVAQAKKEREEVLERYDDQSGLLRQAVISGTSSGVAMLSMASKMAEAALSGKPLQLGAPEA